jgi:hypothetical protein
MCQAHPPPQPARRLSAPQRAPPWRRCPPASRCAPFRCLPFVLHFALELNCSGRRQESVSRQPRRAPLLHCCLSHCLSPSTHTVVGAPLWAGAHQLGELGCNFSVCCPTLVRSAGPLGASLCWTRLAAAVSLSRRRIVNSRNVSRIALEADRCWCLPGWVSHHLLTPGC